MERYSYIDCAKGIGMLLIVLGHCLSPWNGIRMSFSLFHVPLFFFISGLLFDEIKHTFKKFFFGRLKSIMLPCVIFTAIVVLIHCIFFSNDTRSLIYGLPGALWFLPVLFLTEIIYYFLCKIIHPKVILVFLFFLYLIGYSVSQQIQEVYYSYTTIFTSLFFYGLGHFFRRIGFINVINSNNLNLEPIMWLLLPIPYMYIYVCDGIPSSYSENIVPLSNVCVGMCGIISIILLGKYIEKNKLLNMALVWIGKNTIVIMSIHMLYIEILVKYVKPLVKYTYLYKSLEIILLWAFLFVTVKIISKYLKWILGRF